MIFHKKKKREALMFDGNILEVVNSFRYLILVLSLDVQVILLRVKSMPLIKHNERFFSLLKMARKKNLPTDVLLDLYRKMVMPVML